MREESHLDDMRAAIRGDFERLEERRGEQELMRLGEEPEQPAPSSEDAEPAPDAQQTVASGDDVAGEAPRRSWLDRLLGR